MGGISCCSGVFVKKEINVLVLIQSKVVGTKFKKKWRFDEVSRTKEAQLKGLEGAHPCYRVRMAVPQDAHDRTMLIEAMHSLTHDCVVELCLFLGTHAWMHLIVGFISFCGSFFGVYL